MIVALVIAMRHGTPARTSTVDPPNREITRLVWLNEPGPGGGGGGGGNRMKEPPRRAELPGHDAITVPATKPHAPDLSKPVTTEPDVNRALVIPVATLAAATDTLPGAIDAPPAPPTASQGPGDGGGAGPGHGPGDGQGRGPGLGDGRDGGTGGDGYQPGNGVTMPIEIQKGTPRYTSDAMRARVQGAITVQCVVQTSGVCDRIRVLRSFDPAFGLDAEAIKAAAQWRFRPGTRGGQPVPVIVTMEIAFTLR